MCADQHSPFPRKIWQIWQSEPDGWTVKQVISMYHEFTSCWTTMNPKWCYQLVDNQLADQIVREEFAGEPKIRDTFLRLTSPILRADLLRLLLLYAKGGLYTDLDTIPSKPLDEWNLDQCVLSNDVQLVVGIEEDKSPSEDIQPWESHLQFGNWTILARPKSPLLKMVIETTVENLLALAEKQGRSLEDLVPTRQMVFMTTGPSSLTFALFKALSGQTAQVVSGKDFTGIDRPYAFAGLLVLPEIYFAAGKDNCDRATDVHDPAVLVIHKFHNTWMPIKDRKISEPQKLHRA